MKMYMDESWRDLDVTFHLQFHIWGYFDILIW